MQRQGPIAVVILSALFSTITFFLRGAEDIQTYALIVAIVISGFALLLGVDSLILYHMRNIQEGKNTFFSGVLIISFFTTVIWGFFAWWRYGSPFAQDSTFMWLFLNVYLPLDATMFSILAFYISSAAYRAFRARNFNALILLITASVIMIGRVLYSNIVFPLALSVFLFLAGLWIFANTRKLYGSELLFRRFLGGFLMGGAFVILLPPIFNFLGGNISALTDWLLSVPQNAAKRGIYLGLGFGQVAFALRIMFGIERSWIR